MALVDVDLLGKNPRWSIDIGEVIGRCIRLSAIDSNIFPNKRNPDIG